MFVFFYFDLVLFSSFSFIQMICLLEHRHLIAGFHIFFLSNSSFGLYNMVNIILRQNFRFFIQSTIKFNNYYCFVMRITNDKPTNVLNSSFLSWSIHKRKIQKKIKQLNACHLLNHKHFAWQNDYQKIQKIISF